MSYKPRYDRGDWKADCDACGRTFKASELKLRWDNLMVCSQDWEPRQPQDFVRGVADYQAPPWTRTEATDQFIPFNFTSELDATAQATASVVTHTQASVYTKVINGAPLDWSTLG